MKALSNDLEKGDPLESSDLDEPGCIKVSKDVPLKNVFSWWLDLE